MSRKRPRPTPLVTAAIPNLHPETELNGENKLNAETASLEETSSLAAGTAPALATDSPVLASSAADSGANFRGEKNSAEPSTGANPLALRPPRRQRREYPQRRGRARQLPLSKRILKMWPVLLILCLVLGLGGGGAIWFYQQQKQTPQKTEILKVSGDFGAQPVVTLAKELPITLPKTSVIIAGSGKQLLPDEDLFLKISVFSGKDGQSVTPYGVPRLVYGKNTVDLLGADLYQAITGQEIGSRLLVKRPVNEGGQAHMEIDIVDIMPTQVASSAAIAELPVPYQEEAGLPQIGKAAAPLNPTLIQIVTGKGEQVLSGQKVIAQFGVWEIETGTIRDYSWNKQGPQAIDLQNTYQALKAELIDARVGSRLLLLLPASEAKGDKALAVVVDILGVIDDKQN